MGQNVCGGGAANEDAGYGGGGWSRHAFTFTRGKFRGIRPHSAEYDKEMGLKKARLCLIDISTYESTLQQKEELFLLVQLFIWINEAKITKILY